MNGRGACIRALALGLLAGIVPVLTLRASAETIHVAVASNAANVIEELALLFEEATGHDVVLSPGSTGKHYAQVKNGAPFDLFFAADVERPRLLEKEGHGVAGTRFTYAIGRLVLWSREAERVDPGGAVLTRRRFRHLALANPRLAPYGRAARNVLERLEVWDALQSRLVRGENIAQAYQFVHSGNAELGFVALSQLKATAGEATGSQWLVPEDLHEPIEQQAILLNDTPAARAFLEFVKSPPAREVLRRYGYRCP